MSGNERERLKIMAGVAEAEVTLIAASGLMGVTYRQGKRIWRRYQDEGDAGLVHRLRGKPSARRKPEALREQVLVLCAEQRYEGFGPTLLAEQLLQAGLIVDHETLRRWRMAKGQHLVRRRKQQHRDWRERKACMWIGTASIGAKASRVWRNSWRGSRRRRSLGGRWSSWGSS